jgi:6-phosphogluconolactonase/glucosamine-6-phosphate isomerase/deaminase
VAPITDSPKSPANRITLTLPALTHKTRNIIFCGAGDSKAPILKAIFADITQAGSTLTAQMTEPAPYPCGMVCSDRHAILSIAMGSGRRGLDGSCAY